MAIAIKTIPVLKEAAANTFSEKVEASNAMRYTVNFSKKTSVASKILAKAKL